MSNYSYIVPGKPLPHTLDTYPNTNRKRMAIVIKYNTTRKASKLTKTALKPNTGTSKRSFFSTFIIFRSIFFMEAILIQQRKRGLFTQKRRHSMDIRPRYTTAHHVIYLAHRNQFVCLLDHQFARLVDYHIAFTAPYLRLSTNTLASRSSL